MHFALLDREIERGDDSITTLKHVSNAEEYLQDHFPSFPVLPGVMMIEAMAQAARALLDPDDAAPAPWVLGSVRALKYGTFVRPGGSILVRVKRTSADDEHAEFKGEVRLIEPGVDPRSGDAPIACLGKFSMRPARLP